MTDSESPRSRDPRDESVAATLERIRSGVKQRRGELATLGERSEDRELALLELKSREFIEEPRPVSPRPVLGRFLVFARKAVYHLFAKWHARPVLQQQNAFNQTVSRLLQDLTTQVEDLSRHVDRLSRRVAELEALEAGDRDGDDRTGT